MMALPDKIRFHFQLGSVEAVAAAKGELFDAARSGDTIVLNMDDPLVVSLPFPGESGLEFCPH
jgi:UDP-N-acetylmuramyl pentapeptide synthase